MILGKMLPAPSGRVMLIAVPWSTTGPIYYSYDFGLTWQTKTPVGTYGQTSGAFIRKNFIVIGRSSVNATTHEFSNDGLATISQANVTPKAYPQQGIISNDGNIRVSVHGSTGYVNVSTNAGASWIQNGLLYNSWGLTMTETGSVIYASSLSYGYLKKSTNYGTSWENTANLLGVAICYGIAMSFSGQYIYVGAYNKGHYFAMSSDYGVNWSQSMVDTTATGNYHNRVFCSASGQHILMTTNAHQRVYVSNNYGASWTRVLSAYTDMYQVFSTAISDSGKYMVVGRLTANGSFFYSDDYGATWSVKSISGVSYAFYSVGINEV